MRKFRFRLQTLLDHRKAKEDKLLEELAMLRREEAEEIRRLENLRKKLEKSLASVEEALKENLGCDEIFRRDEYSKTIRDDIRLQELTLISVQERVQAKLNEVVEAMKERQVLESLRDKQQKQYLLEVARAEQNQLDDIASTRYARDL